MSYREMKIIQENPIGFWYYSQKKLSRLSEIIRITHKYLGDKYPNIYDEVRNETAHLDDYKYLEDFLDSLEVK